MYWVNKNEIKIEILKDKEGGYEMAYQSRTPSVKLTLENEWFNQLVSILNANYNIGLEDENFSQIAEKLKNKLLTYSVPRTNDDGIQFVDVRFFPNEASDMIWQLLLRAEKNIDIEDYYSTLIQNRENK